MQTYLKTKPVWIQFFSFLGIATISFMIASLVGVAILSKVTGLTLEQMQDSKNWKMNDPNIIIFIQGMILIQFLFLFTVPTFIFSYLSDPKPMQYLGLKAPGSGLYWVLAILLIIVAYPFVEYVGYVNQKIPVGEATRTWMRSMEEEAARQIGFMLNRQTPLELLNNLVFISLFAGIGEELFFRGVLQRMLIRITKNPWMGIVLTGAVFSAFHFQFYGFLPRWFLGVLLGAIYWYSGSLWVAIAAHFFYDAAIIVLVYFNPQMLQNPNETLIKAQEIGLLLAAMVSLAVTFVILRQMEKRSVTRYEAIYNDDFPKNENPFSF